MRVAVDLATLEGAFERLTARDPRAGEDACTAVEWLTAGQEAEPAVFTRRGLQLFLWYELPRKWLIEPEEHAAVPRAVGSFFDELGDLRHTLATFALRAGISSFDLSRSMGARLTMIDRHHGHLARDGREHAIRLPDALNAGIGAVDARWRRPPSSVARRRSAHGYCRRESPQHCALGRRRGARP